MESLDKKMKDFLTEKRREETLLAGEEVPADFLQKAKNLMPARKAAPAFRLSTALFLFLAAGCFTASFLFKRYFLQWLLLSLLFGMRGILDLKSART